MVESAEQAAVSPPKDSSSSPKYYSSHNLNVFTDDGKVAEGTRKMFLVPNPHFDRLPVNINLSAVLLPAGVQDTGESNHVR